jgi:hypothetical protein
MIEKEQLSGLLGLICAFASLYSFKIRALACQCLKLKNDILMPIGWIINHYILNADTFTELHLKDNKVANFIR